jgi:hypothetical protein
MVTCSEHLSRLAVRLVWPRRLLFLLTVAVVLWGIYAAPEFQYFQLGRTLLCVTYVLSAVPSLIQLWLLFGKGLGGRAADQHRVPGVPIAVQKLVHAEGLMWRRLASAMLPRSKRE